MKKHLLIILFILSSYPVMSAANECNAPLKLSSTSQWFPYIYQNDKGATIGVDFVLLRKILIQMGCQLEVVHFPERRMLSELYRGNFDIALGASKNPERLKHFLFSKPYRKERNKFAYRASDNDITVATDLQDILQQKKKIAVNLAGWYGNEIEKAKKDYPLFKYTNQVADRIKMLNHKRVDIVIDDAIVLCSEINRSTFNELNIHPEILFETSIHFIFNKGSVSPIFVKKFNKILDNMNDDGRLAAHYRNQLPAQCKM